METIPLVRVEIGRNIDYQNRYATCDGKGEWLRATSFLSLFTPPSRAWRREIERERTLKESGWRARRYLHAMQIMRIPKPKDIDRTPIGPLPCAHLSCILRERISAEKKHVFHACIFHHRVSVSFQCWWWLALEWKIISQPHSANPASISRL